LGFGLNFGPTVPSQACEDRGFDADVVSCAPSAGSAQIDRFGAVKRW